MTSLNGSWLKNGERVTGAAHPGFLPVPYGEEPAFSTLVYSRKPKARAFEDDWDCMSHPGQIRSATVNVPDVALPDVSRGGVNWGKYFIQSPYAEAAHFLIVQKMLGRFDRVYYYRDAARALYPAALCVLAEPVHAGKAEIALFQHDEKPRREGLVAANIGNPSDSEKLTLTDRIIKNQFRDIFVMGRP